MLKPMNEFLFSVYQIQLNCCSYSYLFVYYSFRFKHPNPEDPKEVPGGYLSDINEVQLDSYNLFFVLIVSIGYRL